MTVLTCAWLCEFIMLLLHSSAILRYLVTQYKLPDHWYPADVHQRARVDEYLSWHSSNLRIGAAELIFSKVCTVVYIIVCPFNVNSHVFVAFMVMYVWPYCAGIYAEIFWKGGQS